MFLSCLRGSEQGINRLLLGMLFLSCLRGSEHAILCGLISIKFLSCLRGSELDRLSGKSLSDKAIIEPLGSLPLFF